MNFANVAFSSISNGSTVGLRNMNTGTLTTSTSFFDDASWLCSCGSVEAFYESDPPNSASTTLDFFNP
jgi:hypothetical protein